MKKWISRSIVLAMIIAMMVPMPVAAKSSKKGGKLVKSVTVYEYRNNRWEKDSKTSFKYDKKKNPVKFSDVDYYGYFMGVPTRGTKTVTTAKYKYKGKKVKSAKFKDGAGMVTETRKYKKGRVTGIQSKEYRSDTDTDDAGNVTRERVRVLVENATIAYTKKGLATSSSYTSNLSGDEDYNPFVFYGKNGAYSGATVYGLTQKKGIPSLITETYAGGSTPTEQTPADTTPSWYAKFNGKGLVIEEGYITDKGVYVPDTTYVYTKKKGKVTQVIKNDVDANNDTGAVTKVTPSRLYKFKYTKTKASAVRYLSMMNDLVGCGTGRFNWY